METKAYIESGILDLYAMGTLSMEEMAGVECMMASHSEIKTELEAIQNSLQHYASTFEKSPPAELRDKVLNSLNFATTNTEEEFYKAKEVPLYTNHESTLNHVITPNKPTNRIGNLYKMGIAASLALLLISGVFNYLLQHDLEDSHKKLADVSQQMQTLQTSSKNMQSQIASLSGDMQLLMTPGNMVIPLGGMPMAPKASATVIWNKKTKSTYIELDKMPEQEAIKQYQLCAIVDGKPVDLGVLPQDFRPGEMIQSKLVEQPQAFAITIEPKGGSVNPTMNQMIVVGNV